MAVIVSINVGAPTEVTYDGSKTMFSGILKKPVEGRIYLDSLGFKGDGCADLRHHGGVDKAVCAYSMDHYPFWENELSKKLSPGAFGENLTLSGLDENTAHLGDVFRIGEAQVQISQPRQPCHKLNKIYDRPEMADRILNTGYTGFYLRVLKPGWVEPGAEPVILEYGDKRISIETANRLMYHDRYNFELIREVLSLKFLSESWRSFFSQRLQ